MPRRNSPTNLQALLKELQVAAGRAEDISVKQLREALGRRSFAPPLLVASLLGFTPIGVIPGIPTILAMIVIVVAGQVALGRHSLWMPGALLNLRVESKRLKAATIKLGPFARLIDKIIRPRLSVLTEPPYSSVIAITCIMIALTVPPFEFVPLVDLPLWGAMVAFSLALFAHDGLLAIIACALTAAGICLAVAMFL
jgi:hypothetical protein